MSRCGRAKPTTPSFAHVRRACEEAGFVPRGGFHCRAEDGVPDVDGSAAASLVLVGSAGRDGFAAFRAAPEWSEGGDALERFTERVLGEAARGLGARALYPHHGPPWLPFQRWARRAEPVHGSPLGLLIHPRVGLWHAYRGALVFAAPLSDLPPRETAASPCVDCAARPCLEACPVGAFGDAGFDVAACAAHLRSAAGEDCLQRGCRARAACPVGARHRHAPEQARFHIQAFARSLGVGSSVPTAQDPQAMSPPRPISRFPVPALEDLPEDLRERILAVQEKTGFVPNVFLALAHRPAEFRAFFGYYDALMMKEGALSKAEREMIVVATSAINDCTYCVVSHGALLRIFSKHPRLGEQVAVNWREAEITERQRAMLAFAVKVAADSRSVGEADFRALREHGFDEEAIWDIGAITAFFALSNRMANLTAMRPNDEFYAMGRDPKPR